MTKTIVLSLVNTVDSSELRHECSLSYDRVVSYPGNPLCSVEFYSPKLGKEQVTSPDIFGCLCELRYFLDSENWKILCNGARFDAYPSAMSRQMGGGQKLYVLKLNTQPTRADLVNIFDQADIDQVGTVEAQIAYYQQWVESVSSKP
jgi:hypothetical protein